ncbi:MAG: DUF2946 family protein [Solirubrobacterales bacterium]
MNLAAKRQYGKAARAMLRELAVLLVMVGMAFQSGTIALSLFAMTSPAMAKGPLGSFICHVPQPGDPSAPAGGEAPAKGDECCLVCQAAQLANGALPPPTLQIPTASAADTPIPVAVMAPTGGEASLHKLPRAPPV